MEDTPIEIKKKKKFCWKCGNPVESQDYEKIDFIPKCSNCGALYPEKPALEAKLAVYQEDYLQTRAEKDFKKLINPLYDMIFNIICSRLKKSGVRLLRDDIEDMVQWSLCTLISYYKEKPEFKIRGSFTSYIEQVVLYPIYNKRDKVRKKKEISIYTNVSKANSDKECTLLEKLSEEKTCFNVAPSI